MTTGGWGLAAGGSGLIFSFAVDEGRHFGMVVWLNDFFSADVAG